MSEGRIENAITENALIFDVALLYDAVILYTSALNALKLEEGGNMTCEEDESWEFGSSLVNYIRTVSSPHCVVFIATIGHIMYK